MIRVLHTESSLGWGGQEKRILREILGLSRPAFQPFLICRPGSRLGDEARAAGVQVEFLRMRGNFDPIAVGRLVNFYFRKKIDIVHTHSSADSWIASAAAKISFRRPRVVRTRHLSCSFNNRVIYNFMADRVVTVGESTRRYMIAEKRIPARRVLTIPTGVDLGEFDPERHRENLRPELGIPLDALVFGSVAVFRRLKGHRYLLEATPAILKQFPGARLLLAGEGPQENNLQRIIDDLKIREAVILPGFRKDVVGVLNTLDVFVFPSLEEALGTAVIEALAMGKPVVASRVGGIPETIMDGENGFLVEPAEPAALADKVKILLGNASLRREMAVRGRKMVCERYDNRQMVRGLEDLYRNLLAERKP